MNGGQLNVVLSFGTKQFISRCSYTFFFFFLTTLTCVFNSKGHLTSIVYRCVCILYDMLYDKVIAILRDLTSGFYRGVYSTKICF